ncbi:MAG TPA: NAD(P)H-hydrate dehydratase, partial [Oscillatoriaceae cyanobacterium]
MPTFDPLPPMPAPGVATAEQTQAIERRLIEEWQYPALLLMERASLAIARFLEQTYPNAPVVVMAGSGNNAADGLGVARLLADRGHVVRVLTVGSAQGELATRQMSWLGRRGVQVKVFGGSEQLGPEWVCLDALFGIGLNRPIKSDMQIAMDWVNKRHWRAVVSVDVPSGMRADSGENMGGLVRADETIALGVLKPGLLMDPALRAVGRLWLADIGFPRQLIEPLPGRLNAPFPLPATAPDAHKGSLGSVLILAGSRSMSGAAILAARAACRSGVGLVYVATGESQRDIVAAAVPEAIVVPLEESEGAIGPEGLAAMAAYFPRVRAIAMGPGLGRADRTLALVDRVLGTFKGPIVLDADALPRQGEAVASRTEPLVLTPHAGEMGRMFGVSAEEAQTRRIELATRAAQAYKAVTVFKGARSLL